MESCPRATDEYSLVLRLEYLTGPGADCQPQKVKYSIWCQQCESEIQRTVYFDSTKVGASASLLTENNQHQLIQEDILFCGKELLRLAMKLLGDQFPPDLNLMIPKYLRDLLNVQVSLNIKHADKELAQIHDAN